MGRVSRMLKTPLNGKVSRSTHVAIPIIENEPRMNGAAPGTPSDPTVSSGRGFEDAASRFGADARTYPKTLTLMVTSAGQEAAVQRALALARELERLASTTDDTLQAVWEAFQRGQELSREIVQNAFPGPTRRAAAPQL